MTFYFFYVVVFMCVCVCWSRQSGGTNCKFKSLFHCHPHCLNTFCHFFAQIFHFFPFLRSYLYSSVPCIWSPCVELWLMLICLVAPLWIPVDAVVSCCIACGGGRNIFLNFMNAQALLINSFHLQVKIVCTTKMNDRKSL